MSSGWLHWEPPGLDDGKSNEPTNVCGRVWNCCERARYTGPWSPQGSMWTYRVVRLVADEKRRNRDPGEERRRRRAEGGCLVIVWTGLEQARGLPLISSLLPRRQRCSARKITANTSLASFRSLTYLFLIAVQYPGCAVSRACYFRSKA